MRILRICQVSIEGSNPIIGVCRHLNYSFCFDSIELRSTPKESEGKKRKNEKNPFFCVVKPLITSFFQNNPQKLSKQAIHIIFQ